MPLKKPGALAGLSFSLEKQSSFNLSDTGTFSSDQFSFGPNGITRSPLSQGEVSALHLHEVELGELIGRGVSSKVYCAVHKSTGKLLAIKVMQAELEASMESRRMVLNEVKVVFDAHSDHLVSFYDAFLHEGAVYLALEFMDRGSMEGALQSIAASPAMVMPEAMLANILFQILQGLTYLHKEKHAVHRDLKPANILLNSAGYVKLSDFGISKQLGSGTYANAQTHCGTLAYMSPERVKAEPYSYASDIWSLGLIALEGVCGSHPYPASAATTYYDVVQAILEEPPPTERPEIKALLPSDLLDLIHTSLAKHPLLRPDVLRMMRHPFIQRHQVTPSDLRKYLAELQHPAPQS